MKNKKNTQPLSIFARERGPVEQREREEAADELPEERELKALFSSWSVPPPPQSLESRLLDSFRREFKRAPAWKRLLGARPQLQQHMVPSREEVFMKQCPTCQEEFANKFSFCPVDGTPLNELAAAIVASPPPASPPADDTPHAAEQPVSAIPTYTNPGYHLTIIEDAGITSRLLGELRSVKEESRLTWPEFKRNPKAFTSRLVSGYGRSTWRFFSTPTVAIGTLSAILFVGIAILLLFGLDRWRVHSAELAEQQRQDIELTQMVDLSEIPDTAPEKEPDKGIGTGEKGRVGFNKGKGEGSEQQFKRAGGGGGGGRQEQEQAQQGKIPPPSPIPAAIPKLPPMTPPALPMGGTDIDKALYKNLPYSQYGDPRSKSTEPSNGTGKGGGMGSGEGAGTGEGQGAGFGPGRGGNIGNGDRQMGGGGGGGGTGFNGEAPTDYNKTFSPREVTQKARILSRPEPQYTEEARKNQVSGTVVLKAVFSSGGQVTNIRAVSGLPYGLTERAIAAARQIRFTPAMKDGRAVSQYIQIEYNFNLY
jgi:TonB family protein